MNKNLLVVVGALVVGVVIGFFLFRPTSSPTEGTVTVTPYNALNQQILVNELQSIANVTGSLSATTTAAYGPGALGAVNTSTSTAEKTFSVTGAAVGDYVLVGLSTSTANVSVTGRVSAANVVSVDLQNQSSSSQTPATSTYNLTIVPFASFQAPVGL